MRGLHALRTREDWAVKGLDEMDDGKSATAASSVARVEFLGDGNAIATRSNDLEELMAADEVPEFLLREQRKWRESQMLMPVSP